MINNSLIKKLICIILLPVFLTCVLPTEETPEEETTVEYSILPPVFPGDSYVSTDFSGSFNIFNSGNGNGTSPITWKLYLSDDNVFQSTDTEIDTGSISGLTATSYSQTISFSGTWPSETGDYFLIIVISGTEITPLTDSTEVSTAITISAVSGPASGVDYRVIIPDYPDSTTISSNLNGSFNIQNNGTENGAQTVTWEVYLSTDNAYQNTDTLVDSGFISALNASLYTEVTYSGTWPSTAGDYYLIIVLSATDDGDISNNEDVSTAITISEGGSETGVVDYTILAPVYPADSAIDSTINGSFYIQNAGLLNGSDLVTWTVYRSDNNTYESTDTVVDTNQISALSSLTSQQITYSGTWPSTIGDYYLIIVLTAADDSDTSNNQNVSTAITLTEVGGTETGIVDYTVIAPVYPEDSFIDTALEGSFYIQNIGQLDGAELVDWVLYISDNNTFEGSDLELDFGQITALPSLGSTKIDYSVTWPSTTGNYYLIVLLVAGDDSDTSNNDSVSSVIALTEDPNAPNPGVDYELASITYPNDAQVDTAISGSFYIVNVGETDGSSSISWNVYLSDNTTYESETDQVIDSGLITGISSSAFQEITFTGTWPSTAGTYYVILVVTATDDADTTNNTEVSTAITISEVPVVEYSITSPVYPADGVPDAQFNGSFKVTNNGTANGTADITWNVYLSSDAILDGTDTVVGNGTQSAITAGNSSQFIPYSGTWPSAEGSYYIFITISASDDSDTSNNEDSNVVAIAPVVGVDYIISSSSLPTSGVISLDYSGTFRIQNVGSSNATFTPSWNVYLSSDNIYDVGDTQVQAGVFSGPLASGSISEEISFSGTWPSTAGDYYLIVRITASEDIDDTNNELVSDVIGVTEIVDYTVINESFPLSGALSGSYSGTFRINNIGTVDGTESISWEVHRSTNNTLDENDVSVQSGSISALTAGSTSSAIAFSGAWPATAANYYLIIEISSTDDAITSNNQSVSSVISIIDSGRIVVVGDNATVKYSNDGATTWNSALVSPTTTLDLVAVATNKTGAWVACGDSALIYYSIDNGATWQPGVKGASVTTTYDLYDVEYHNGKWLITGNYGVLIYSTDGINWEMNDTTAQGIYAITWDDTFSRWYGSNIGNSYGYYITYDGNGIPQATFLGTGTGGYYGVADNNATSPTRIVGAGYNKYRYSDDGGVSWIDATSYTTGHEVRGLVYDGNVTWVAVSRSSSRITYSINNGVDWVEASSYDNTEYYYDVAYDSKSDRFIAVGYDGIISYSSDGGSTWTRAANTGTVWLQGVAVGP